MNARRLQMMKTNEPTSTGAPPAPANGAEKGRLTGDEPRPSPARAKQREKDRRRGVSARRAMQRAGIRAWEAEIIDGAPRFLTRSPEEGEPDGAVRARVHPEDLERLRFGFEAALVDRRPFSVECRIEVRAGVFRRSHCWCSIVPAKGGARDRLVVLERSLGAPDSAVAPVTASRDGSVAAASAGLDADMLAYLSQELRSPMTTIRGNARVLHRQGERLAVEERQQAYVDIVDAADRILELIDNLMTLARAGSAQRQGSQAQPVSLPDAVSAAVARLRQDRPERQVTLVAPDIMPRVSGSAGYVEQIAENLLTNALKFSGPDSPVEVVIEPGETDVVVHVLDRGQGIDMAETEKLFLPFYRSSNVARQYPGSGVGLAVCKQLVEAQGGLLWAQAREGGGSDFAFSLPVHVEEEQSDGAQSLPA